MNRRGLMIGAVLAASLLSHLKGIASPMLDYHYHRQCNTAAIARNYHENGLHFFSPQIDWEGPYRGRSATEFPLYMWLMGVLWSVAGLGDLWGRLLSAAFSAGTAVYLFLFLERKLDRAEALAGALIFTAIPLEVYFGRTVQPEAIALFAAIAALDHWDRSLSDGRPLGHWAATVLFAFLAIAHKLPYVPILWPLAVMSWLRLKDKVWSDWRTIAAPALALGAVYAWYRYASTGLYVVPSHPNEFFSMLNYGRLPYYVWFSFGSRFPELAVTWPGMLLWVIGAREILWRRKDLLFLAWLGGAAAMIVASGGYSFHHEYTELPFVPANAALMGVGFISLKEKAASRRARAALAALALAIPIYTVVRIKHWYNTSYAFLKNAEKAASAVSGPDDLFVCNERATSVFLYYAHRRGWSWDLTEQGPDRLFWLNEKIVHGARFYLTRKTGLFEDKTNVLSRALYDRFPVVYDADDLLIFRLAPAKT